jgi:hypothetical protein
MKNEFSDRAPVLPVRVYRLDKGAQTKGTGSQGQYTFPYYG